MRTAYELPVGAVSRGAGYLFLNRECAEELLITWTARRLLEASAFGPPDCLLFRHKIKQ